MAVQVATFRLELTGFGGAPVTLDARLAVQDSPNSAGVVIDAVRFLKVARELGIKGSLRGASAFTQVCRLGPAFLPSPALMLHAHPSLPSLCVCVQKTPPQQLMFRDAKAECDALAKRELTEMTKAQVV